MDTREYLQQIKTLHIKIRQRQAEAHELREAAMSIGSPSPDKEKVQSSGVKDAIAEQVTRYTDMLIEIDFMIWDLSCLKHRIIGEIHQLTDARYIDILFKRYVEIKTWELIAVEMNYSYDYVKELNAYALEEFHNKVMVPTQSHLNTDYNDNVKEYNEDK